MGLIPVIYQVMMLLAWGPYLENHCSKVLEYQFQDNHIFNIKTFVEHLPHTGTMLGFGYTRISTYQEIDK